MEKSLEESYQRALAVAKQQSTKTDQSFIGTCQVCFNQFVVKKRRGELALVLHGFERPGSGYIIRSCPGENYPPYEISKDRTVEWIEALKGQIPILKKEISATPTADKLPYTKIVYDKNLYKYVPKIITYEKSHQFTRNDPFDNWQELIDHSIREITKNIKHIESDITVYTQKVKAWKYTPESLRTHEAVKAKEREKASRASAQKKAERQAKQSVKEEKKQATLQKVKDQIASYMAQPEFIRFVKETVDYSLHGEKVSRFHMFEYYLQRHEKENEENMKRGRPFDDYHLRQARDILKEAAKDARRSGYKVKG